MANKTKEIEVAVETPSLPPIEPENVKVEVSDPVLEMLKSLSESMKSISTRLEDVEKREKGVDTDFEKQLNVSDMHIKLNKKQEEFEFAEYGNLAPEGLQALKEKVWGKEAIGIILLAKSDPFNGRIKLALKIPVNLSMQPRATEIPDYRSKYFSPDTIRSEAREWMARMRTVTHNHWTRLGRTDKIGQTNNLSEFK